MKHALLAALLLPACLARAGVVISDEAALVIGKKIWMNEGGGKVELLTWWDETPNCPSMGINHYIWYPADRRGPFQETFPGLLAFMAERGAVLPAWLKGLPPSPWSDRESFFRDMQSERMKELRSFLADSVPLQARYSANRLEQALPQLLSRVSEAERKAVEGQFYRVANSSNGVYALVDYVNFKGEGVSPKERYHDPELGRDEGWGLLQVLQSMTGAETGDAALDAFADAAGNVLRRRVRNCPPPAERQATEKRWLEGWLKRIETYRSRPLQAGK